MHFNFRQNACAYPDIGGLEYSKRWYFKATWTVSSKDIFFKNFNFLAQNHSTLDLYDKLTILLSNFWNELYLTDFWWRILTFVAFFQYTISPLFFDCFQKSWWSTPKICICDFKFAFVHVSKHHWCIVCWIINDSIFYEQFDKFKIFRIWDENVNFINFYFLRKRSLIEHRLHRLYWTFKCLGIGYGLNWSYYSSLKPTAFIAISVFQNSMLKSCT